MKLNLFIIALVFCLISCAQGEQETSREEIINPHHSALPDSDVMIETELSEIDKKRLAAAKGKEVSSISLDKLNANLENMKEKVGLCYFWNNTNDKTEVVLQELDKISDQLDAEKLDIFLINTSRNPDINQINGIVRASGIDAEAFLLQNEKIFGEIAGDSGEWSGKFPAYYVYQSEDKSGLWLDGEKDGAELYAMLQTFVF